MRYALQNSSTMANLPPARAISRKSSPSQQARLSGRIFLPYQISAAGGTFSGCIRSHRHRCIDEWTSDWNTWPEKSIVRVNQVALSAKDAEGRSPSKYLTTCGYCSGQKNVIGVQEPEYLSCCLGKPSIQSMHSPVRAQMTFEIRERYRSIGRGCHLSSQDQRHVFNSRIVL